MDCSAVIASRMATIEAVTAESLTPGVRTVSLAAAITSAACASARRISATMSGSLHGGGTASPQRGWLSYATATASTTL